MDGRAEIVDDARSSPADVRVFLADSIATLRANPHFRDGVAGALLPDAASQARAEAIVLPRLDQIVAEGLRRGVRFRADIDSLLDPSL